VFCIDIEYWVNRGDILDGPDSDSEDESVADYEDYSSVAVPTMNVSEQQFWSGSTCVSDAELEPVPKYFDPKLYSHEGNVPFLKSQDLQVRHCIGQGRTGVVWKGLVKNCETSDVAIKQISASCDNRKVLQFLGDISALCSTPHPNIVRLLGVTFGEQPVQLVTEYCAGGSCYDVVYGSAPLTDMQAGKVCVDVAEAMSHLHGLSPKILHHNLTLRNVLLAEALTCSTSIPDAKVSDYNFTRLASDGDDKSAYDSIRVAPEAKTGLYSDKADVYSFAVFMYEMFYGKAPFEDVHATDLPEVHDGNADALWFQVICAGWALDPASRPSFDTIKYSLPQVSVFGRNVSL
jgi:serine/threonine protein kinase